MGSTSAASRTLECVGPTPSPACPSLLFVPPTCPHSTTGASLTSAWHRCLEGSDGGWGCHHPVPTSTGSPHPATGCMLRGALLPQQDLLSAGLGCLVLRLRSLEELSSRFSTVMLLKDANPLKTASRKDASRLHPGCHPNCCGVLMAALLLWNQGSCHLPEVGLCTQSLGAGHCQSQCQGFVKDGGHRQLWPSLSPVGGSSSRCLRRPPLLMAAAGSKPWGPGACGSSTVHSCGTGTPRAELPHLHLSPINRHSGAVSDQTVAWLMGAAAAPAATGRALALLVLWGSSRAAGLGAAPSTAA